MDMGFYLPDPQDPTRLHFILREDSEYSPSWVMKYFKSNMLQYDNYAMNNMDYSYEAIMSILDDLLKQSMASRLQVWTNLVDLCHQRDSNIIIPMHQKFEEQIGSDQTQEHSRKCEAVHISISTNFLDSGKMFQLILHSISMNNFLLHQSSDHHPFTFMMSSLCN